MRVKKDVLDSIIAHAKKDSPVEACGYLACGEGKLVSKHYELTNVDKSTEHFSFDPKEQFSALRDARGKNLNICAVYHSHPYTPARPSVEDIKLAYDPNLSYVIVSLAAGKTDVKSFRIDFSGAVQNEELEIIQDV